MKLAIKVAAVLACIGLSACDVDRTQDAQAPDIDVDANAGQLPRYDVDAPDVNVGTENVVVQVPDVDINAPNDDEAAVPANRQ